MTGFFNASESRLAVTPKPKIKEFFHKSLEVNNYLTQTSRRGKKCCLPTDGVATNRNPRKDHTSKTEIPKRKRASLE
jgi:hypothetical protein